ncbi:helix-turn-helix domain-containing protein, partial [Hominenteromicrobium sp.]|uniref:helix-turn-helix domain-containing protein n=1 Tax=Hominenteromicrobium sp. TaxID=3073581 RepID=UPI003A938DD5
MSNFMSPGRRIRHYRMLRGMTQKALGIAAGFSPETADIRIAQYESGVRTPKHALLCTLAEALGVSPSALDIPRIKSHEVLKQLLHAIGMVADRLSVNIEMPTAESLALYAPQKKPKEIFAPMRQITNSLIERNALTGPGTMFKGKDINTAENYLETNALR